MKKLTSIALSALMVLSITFFNETPAKAVSGHEGMSVLIGVNGHLTNQYIDTYIYPYKVHVNEKFEVLILINDDGHDISMSYGTDSADGLQNYNSNGWEGISNKGISFQNVSFSTPGRHLVYATVGCKQTGQIKSISFYIDVE